MAGAYFRYVPGGTIYPYRLDYATQAEADAAAAWLGVNGFWYQRPDNPTVYGASQTVTAVLPVSGLLLEGGVSYLVQEDGASKVLVT